MSTQKSPFSRLSFYIVHPVIKIFNDSLKDRRIHGLRKVVAQSEHTIPISEMLKIQIILVWKGLGHWSSQIGIDNQSIVQGNDGCKIKSTIIEKRCHFFHKRVVCDIHLTISRKLSILIYLHFLDRSWTIHRKNSLVNTYWYYLMALRKCIFWFRSILTHGKRRN